MTNRTLHKYIERRSELLSLQVVESLPVPRKVNRKSILNLLNERFSGVVRAIARTPINLWKIGFRGVVSTLGLRNSCVSRKAILLGNGPSQYFLREEDIKALKKEGYNIVVVNHFLDNPLFQDISPDYCVINDPVMLQLSPRTKDFHKFIQNTKNVKYFVNSTVYQRLRQMTEETDVFPFISTPIFLKLLRHPLIGVDFIDMTTLHGLNMLQFAGFSEILLLGVDNTYPHCIYSDNQNRALLLEEHACSDPFLKDFSENWSITDLLTDALEIFESYGKFQPENIRNCDPYSLLDVFQKEDKFNLTERYYEM